MMLGSSATAAAGISPTGVQIQTGAWTRLIEAMKPPPLAPGEAQGSVELQEPGRLPSIPVMVPQVINPPPGFPRAELPIIGEDEPGDGVRPVDDVPGLVFPSGSIRIRHR